MAPLGSFKLLQTLLPAICSDDNNSTLNSVLKLCGDYCCLCCTSFGSSFHLNGIPFFVVLNTKLLLQAFKFLQASLPAIYFFDHYVTFNDLLGATMNNCGGCSSAAGALA